MVEEKEKNKFYTCKDDRVFKEIFMKKENKDLLIALLESILDIKIKELKYLNLEKNVDNIKVRRKYFDLHVKTETENIHIEVNSEMKKYVRPRNASFLFYTYSHEVLRGNDYDEDTLFMIDYTMNNPKIGVTDKIWYNYYKNSYSITNKSKSELEKYIRDFKKEIKKRLDKETRPIVKLAYNKRIEKINRVLEK